MHIDLTLFTSLPCAQIHGKYHSAEIISVNHMTGKHTKLRCMYIISSIHASLAWKLSFESGFSKVMEMETAPGGYHMTHNIKNLYYKWHTILLRN